MEVNYTEVQNNFFVYLKYAAIEDVYITCNGQRIAVLKSYANKVSEGGAIYQLEKPKMSLEEFFDFSKKVINAMSLLQAR